MAGSFNPPPSGPPPLNGPPPDGSGPRQETGNQLPSIADTGRGGRGRNRVRPWWGMGDALMLIPILGVMSVLAVIAVLVVGDEPSDLSDPDAIDLPIWAFAVFTLLQQIALFVWPLIVSRWKGLGPAKDWGLSFKAEDLGIGLGVAFIGAFAAGLVSTVTAAIVDLEDQDDGSNLQLLEDADGTIWLWVIIFTVVVMAPLAEEVLFRGLILRSVANRFGSVIGVIVSVLAFAPLHMADGGFFSDGQIVLVASIASLAITFAVTALITGRLGASIVAHMIVNAIGVIGALELTDEWIGTMLF